MLSVVAYKATVLVMLGFYIHVAMIATFSPAQAHVVIERQPPS